MNWSAFDPNPLMILDAVAHERSLTRAGRRLGMRASAPRATRWVVSVSCSRTGFSCAPLGCLDNDPAQWLLHGALRAAINWNGCPGRRRSRRGSGRAARDAQISSERSVSHIIHMRSGQRAFRDTRPCLNRPEPVPLLHDCATLIINITRAIQVCEAPPSAVSRPRPRWRFRQTGISRSWRNRQ
jgi:hypothetical protein